MEEASWKDVILTKLLSRKFGAFVIAVLLSLQTYVTGQIDGRGFLAAVIGATVVYIASEAMIDLKAIGKG